MRRKALLVHGDVNVLVALRSELQRRGFMTLAARSADEAVDLHQGIAPDVVLLGADLDDGPGGALRVRLESGAPLLLLSGLPANPVEIATRAAAALAPSRPAEPDLPLAPPRTPTVVLPPTPVNDPARIDTLITEFLPPTGEPYGKERDDDDGALVRELEHPLYETQVTAIAGPRPETGGDEDDSYSDERLPTREQLDTNFFDLALGGTLDESAPSPLPPPSPPGPEAATRLATPHPIAAAPLKMMRPPAAPVPARPAQPAASSAAGGAPVPAPVPMHSVEARRSSRAAARPPRRGPAPAPAPVPATQPIAVPSPPAADTRPRAILLLDGRATESGDLARVDFARLLCAIHEGRLDGTLSCRLAAAGPGDVEPVEIEKSLAFRGGTPIFASSTDPADRLSELLFREGRLTRDQRSRAAEALGQAHPGRRVGALLLDLGFLKEAELVPAVTRHLQFILYSLFGWTQGAFRFLAGEPAPGEVITLSTPVPLLVLEGVRRKYDQARLGALLPLRAVPSATDELESVVRMLELGDDGRRLLAAIDGRRTVASLVEGAQLRPVEAMRLLHCAVLLKGALVRTPAAETAPGAPAPAPALEADAVTGEQTLREANTRGAAPAPRAGPPVEHRPREEDIDRERLREKYRQVRNASYFEILGVTPAATEYEVRRAYEALRATFGAEHYAGQRASQLKEELEEVAAVLRDAYEVLSDDGLREAYAAARYRDGR